MIDKNIKRKRHREAIKNLYEPPHVTKLTRTQKKWIQIRGGSRRQVDEKETRLQEVGTQKDTVGRY